MSVVESCPYYRGRLSLCEVQCPSDQTRKWLIKGCYQISELRLQEIYCHHFGEFNGYFSFVSRSEESLSRQLEEAR